MVAIALGILWFLIGLIILCGIVYLAIWVIEQFVTAIPEKIKQGVWVIILLLALIALITVLMGGSIGGIRPFRMGLEMAPSWLPLLTYA